MRETIKKRVELSFPQAMAIKSPQKKKMIIGGRGAGKSNLLGPVIAEMARQMPRGTFYISTSTYAQALTNTLPSTLASLENLGLYQDHDFVVGTCGKKYGYEMPFQSPQQWNNVIHFSNGTIFVLISQDNERTGRGFNTLGGIADEIQGQDETKLYNSAQSTNRAYYDIFKNCSLMGAEVYVGSMPMTKKASWIWKYEDLAKKEPLKYLFLLFSAKSNHRLRPDYFESMLKNSPSKTVYEAEILNIRPSLIANGFYPQLDSDRHYYTDHDNLYLEGMVWLPKEGKFDKSFDCRMDNDLDKDAPLILSFDFGLFKSLTVSQDRTDLHEYRLLKEFFVKHPFQLDDLVMQFIEYYRPHRDKMIYLYGGHDGNNKQSNDNRTLFDVITDILQKNGWIVNLMTHGAAPTHNKKYYVINAVLKRNDSRFPMVRINQSNCPNLIISMENAEAGEGTSGVQKIKRDENNASMLQEHTTHLSDTFDIPVYDRFVDIYLDNDNKTSAESKVSIIV